MGQINLEVIKYKGKKCLTIIMRVKGKRYYSSMTAGWTEDIRNNVPIWNLNNRAQAEADYRTLIKGLMGESHE